jgi:hypothetical protein
MFGELVLSMLSRVELEHGLVAHAEHGGLVSALGVLRHGSEGANLRDRVAGILAGRGDSEARAAGRTERERARERERQEKETSTERDE